MADIDDVKQGCKCCDNPLGERKCKKCPYVDFLTPYCHIQLAHDAMSVIEELQAEIARLKAENEKAFISGQNSILEAQAGFLNSIWKDGGE